MRWWCVQRQQQMQQRQQQQQELLVQERHWWGLQRDLEMVWEDWWVPEQRCQLQQEGSLMQLGCQAQQQEQQVHQQQQQLVQHQQQQGRQWQGLRWEREWDCQQFEHWDQ